MSNVVAFSGGKDSTAMALRMAELGETFSLLFTPTGRELPAVDAHIARMVEMTGAPLILPPTKSLDFWIREHNALPNWRQRWCTRQIKIVPCIAHLQANPGTVLNVGLRADEEDRVGLYGSFASYRYPLREWGWGLGEVNAYLRAREIDVPRRTDCDICYGQRLGEWFELWRDYPDRYAAGEAYEMQTGHTLRSPGRDTWPAALVDLRARFERGDVPRGVRPPEGDRSLAWVDDEQDEAAACRVCRL